MSIEIYAIEKEQCMKNSVRITSVAVDLSTISISFVVALPHQQVHLLTYLQRKVLFYECMLPTKQASNSIPKKYKIFIIEVYKYINWS